MRRAARAVCYGAAGVAPASCFATLAAMIMNAPNAAALSRGAGDVVKGF